MQDEIQKYIDTYAVGPPNFHLFRDWGSFLRVLYAHNGRVNMIVWYDHVKISEQQKSIGRGGYMDLQNREYMWAETDLAETDLQGSSLDELLACIANMRRQFAGYDLYPEFYLA